MDDLLGACENNTILKKFWKKLATTFKIRDLCTPANFLGVEIKYLPGERCVVLSQQ